MIKVSNSLNPGQAQYFIRPDLGPNCLQKLSVAEKSEEITQHWMFKLETQLPWAQFEP